MKSKQRNGNKTVYALLFILSVILSFGVYVSADPAGTTISNNVTDLGAVSTPDNRSDPGGSITTMILDAVQQNSKWKAYVGNITGTLTLDDSNGNTIFDWALSASGITGEIYATRAQSPTWASVACTSLATIGAEETALGHTGSDVDSIRNTFNETIHPTIITAGITINANTCNSTSTFVSDTRQLQASADFPLVLLHDTTNLIYAAPINQDTTGYDGATTADFQMIVADDVTLANTQYFFFAEIG